MNTMNSYNALDQFKSQQDQILEQWIQEIEENPRFESTSLKGNTNLKSHSKLFLSNLFKTLESESVPSFSKQAIEPILKLWHRLVKEQMEGGFSTKDTAMLIYALKTSLISFIEQSHSATTPQSKESLIQIEQVLDLLGILTFEMYSIENEKLISRQSEQINYLQSKESKLFRKLIGSSPAMNQLYKAIGLVLENDLTVLLEGESGTGKDLIANIIHTNSKRSHKPFISINCGAIPKELIESELFGHEKGAFTDAHSQRIGKFELADGGTLFLDEIGDLPMDLQVKLLRVLQNKEIERVGGSGVIGIDVRVIAATHRNLKKKIDEETFRLDLFYRLNVFPISVPALRQRKEDIIPLAEFFINKYSKELSLPASSLTEDAKSHLINQYWEGNIRELENVVQRSLVLSQGQPITSAILSLQPGQADPILLASSSQQTLESTTDNAPILSLEQTEKQAIKRALTKTNGNILKTSKLLEISRTTLYNKIEKYQLTEFSKPHDT